MEQESNSDFSIEEISNIKESIFNKYINKMKDLYIKKIMIMEIVQKY